MEGAASRARLITRSMAEIMAKNEKQENETPEVAPLEGIRIPKSLMPTAKITHAGRSKKDANGNEIGGTIDQKDHEYRRQVPALSIAGETLEDFTAGIADYLALNKALSVKGALVVIKRPNGTELQVPTRDPDDKGQDGQQDGRTLIPCKGLPLTFAELVTAINDAVDAVHKSEQNAKLTADFAVKPGKQSKVEPASDGTIPDSVTY